MTCTLFCPTRISSVEGHVSNLFPFCIISRARASPAPWRDFGIACA
jgi:hypothetical protein